MPRAFLLAGKVISFSQLSAAGLALLLVAAACASEPSSRDGDPAHGAGSGGLGAGSAGENAAGNHGGNSVGGGAGSVTAGGGQSSVGGSGGSAATTGGGAGSNTAGLPGGGSGGSTAGSAGATAGGQAGVTGGGGGSSGSAGSATAGAAGSSGAAGLPAFVTSGPNDYWNTEGALTVMASGTADLTVDANTRYQQFTGFGGTFNEMGWDALSVLGAEEVTRALKLLFDAHEGANFVYGRLPLGASDYAMSWYTLAETAGDYEMNDFSIARDREKLIPYVKAALAIKPDIRLWASPWVVPSWMMSGSSMKSDAQTLGAHALYMARFVEEYEKEGLVIEAIHPQNEPGYARVRWTQALFIDFIKTYLGPTFAARNLTAEIWCGTMSKDPDDTNIAKALANDAAAMAYTKGFGVQWNLQAAVATLAEKAPVMQTEHKCGNYNFQTPYWDQSRYDPDQPQNDHLYGEESWQLIRDWIVAGVNSYSAWNMVLDTTGKSLDNWPQNALLTVDRAAKQLIVTPAYYAFRHFSGFVAPGATRVQVSGSTDAIAFQNVDGSIVTEIYNKSESPKTTTLGVGGALYRFDVPAHGWATLHTTP
ncbi:MAG TPA: glycoside hydrolase family 30 protein [Polyangiaceae bacterium]